MWRKVVFAAKLRQSIFRCFCKYQKIKCLQNLLYSRREYKVERKRRHCHLDGGLRFRFLLLWLSVKGWKPERLRMYRHFPLIIQALSFDFTEPILWWYWNAEPSTLTRRTFAIATPKARQVDAEPSATSLNQIISSVNPQMRFWKSPNALHRKHFQHVQQGLYGSVRITFLE